MMTYTLPPVHQAALTKALEDWKTHNKVHKLWTKDASLWTGKDESQWMGWLSIVDDQLADVGRFQKIANEVRERGFSDILLLGMGGSSLCPEVLALSFGHAKGFPRMHVLDSTDPAQIRAIQAKIDVKHTLFIVSSKSGSTLEPNIYKQYFYEQSGKDGGHFFAITDPGSKMQDVAERDGFRNVFFGVPSIGGRYSALSDFGMVPAAAMGIDVKRFLEAADAMARECSATTPVEKNPGVVLGLLLGTLGRAGRDKVTIVASPGIHDLGAWLEQLIAESTGKIGKGLIPVDREPLGPPEVYGTDRVFAYLRLEGAPDPAQDRAIDALAAAGHPVVRISLPDAYHLGAEFFRWEIATAVAGSILEINPFDQPDVEASKIATKKLTAAYEQTGSLPPEGAFTEVNGLKVFGDLSALIHSIAPGDYFALLAYIEMNPEHETAMEALRTRVRDAKRVATCVGFGPRFLHSTGQAYKGGPNSGVFLQITADVTLDLPVPDQTYTFGVVKAAQARGDLQVLEERGRRALRVHLGSDVKAGLVALTAMAEKELAGK
jgi:glucose-6-phosphate isomerase